MDEDFFINPTQFEHQSTLSTWKNLSSSMEIQPIQSPNCFLSPNPTSDHFETPISNDNFLLRELIGKLGNICNSSDIINNAQTLPHYISGANTSLSSPPKIGVQIMDHMVKENFSSMGNSIALGSNLPAMPGSPGIAERATRFSCLGSRSFNGRTSQFGATNNVEVGYRSNNNGNLSESGNGKLERVCSSPSLNMNQSELINSRENSSVSCQNPRGENGLNRKRKAAPKGKSKEYQYKLGDENGEESSAKRSKSEGNVMEEKKTEENRGDEEKKQSNSSCEKPPEPPKDYIHVRARRGQATDSHSLAERVRREKIGERMKLLQDLVPGCNKVTGKALMLDEIINYVQSLQRQVEFLSMKLASMNPRLEFNVNNLFSKDHVIQQNCSMPHPMYPIQSLTPTRYGQPHQNSLQNTSSTLTSEGYMAPFSMDPLNHTSNQNNALQVPPIDGFPNAMSKVSSLCGSDLQSIVEMCNGQKENEFQSPHCMGLIKHH